MSRFAKGECLNQINALYLFDRLEKVYGTKLLGVCQIPSDRIVLSGFLSPSTFH